MKRFLALFCLLILSISLSHADVIVNIVESDGDVVATASGTIDFDQQFGGTGTSPGGFVSGNGSSKTKLSVGASVETPVALSAGVEDSNVGAVESTLPIFSVIVDPAALIS